MKFHEDVQRFWSLPCLNETSNTDNQINWLLAVHTNFGAGRWNA